MKITCTRIYKHIFEFISKYHSFKDTPDKYLHAHLVTVFSSGVIMWSYAFLAYFTISSRIPGIVGLICSIVHLLSPFLYRRFSNNLFNASVLLAAGLIHQATFAFFTGGFDSNILIWLGILPMLAGIMAGKRGAILWAIITTLVISFFLGLKLSGFQFPHLISKQGLLLAQILILFGWVFIATSVIWVYIFLVEKNANELEASQKRTQNFINILSHDISTPLMVIILKPVEFSSANC